MSESFQRSFKSLKSVESSISITALLTLLNTILCYYNNYIFFKCSVGSYALLVNYSIPCLCPEGVPTVAKNTINAEICFNEKN